MSKPGYALLQDVIMDADFPDLDLALRRGRHVDREDAAWYALLSDAQEPLEQFYRRYGCELIHKTDGYFYLLPTGDKISRKQLAAADMLVGQALALLYLDPANIERGGVIAQEDLVAQLSSVLGSDALIAAFNPGTGAGKKKKYDERIAQRNVRNRVGESVRRLAGMGFVDVADDDKVRLRPALMRFAEPVRGLSEPAEALAKLVARGEVALEPEDGEGVEAAVDSGELAEPISGVTARLDAHAAAESGEAPSDEVLDNAVVDALAADGGELGRGEAALDRAVALELGADEPSEALAAEGGEPSAAADAARTELLHVAAKEPELHDDAPAAASSDAAALSGEGELPEVAVRPPDAVERMASTQDASAPPQAARDDAPRPQPTAAGPVHPMDQDLDWADILPDAPEPEEPG